jgi:hypothetical protein
MELYIQDLNFERCETLHQNFESGPCEALHQDSELYILNLAELYNILLSLLHELDAANGRKVADGMGMAHPYCTPVNTEMLNDRRRRPEGRG